MQGNRALAVGTVVCLVLAISSLAAPATVSITVVPRAGVAVEEVSLALIPADSSADTKVLRASLNTSLTAELQEGVWYLEVRDPGVWHQRQAFVARIGVQVVAAVWPRATIKGRLTAGRGEGPSNLQVHVQSQTGAPAGELDCSLDGTRFSCVVPSGDIDARVRAPGYVAAHYPALRLAPGQTLDVGEVALQRGSSIVGRVEAAADELPNVQVRATASVAGQARQSAIQATPARSGLFHLDGIAPGEYRVDAFVTTERRSKPVSVVVQRDSEIELGDPLRIERRRPLSVSILPSLDPFGSRWTVQIDEEHVAGHLETLERRRASPEGIFASTGLAPGEYVVTISSSAGGTWHEETVHIDREQPAQLVINLPVTAVKGQVKLGVEPLAAELRFTGTDSPLAVTMRSDDTGRFAGFLPSKERQHWTVRVRAEQPRAARTFRDLRIDDQRSVDLVLPMTTLAGRVVGAEGGVVWPATVNVHSSAERLVQSTVERDGSFAVHGLPPGGYRISATALDMQSAVQDVSVPDDPASEPEPLVLVLEKEREVSGTITSRLGPVAGANVLVFPLDTEPALGVFLRATDAYGRFTAFVPAGTQVVDVHVAAPGLSYSTAIRRLSSSAMSIAVDDRAGTLRVSVGGGGMRPVLVHNGSVIEVRSLIDSWTGRKTDEGGHRTISIPLMAAGDYTLCAVPAAARIVRVQSLAGFRCTTAILPPFGVSGLTINAE